MLRIRRLIPVCALAVSCLHGFQSSAAPPRARVHLERGVMLLQQKKYAEARQEFIIATQDDPASAEAFFYLATAELKLGNFSASERSFRRSLELNPNSVNTLYNLGVLLLDRKRPQQALGFLEKANRIGPRSAELSINLARAYIEDGRKDRALQVANTMGRRFENAPEVQLSLGKLFLAHDLAPEARPFLERADRLVPSQVEIVLPLADACLEQRDPEAARQALESIKAGSQDLAQYHYLLGKAYFVSGQKAESLDEIHRAISLEPQNPTYLLTLGRYEQKYGDQRAAITVLEKAQRLAPDLAEIPYSMAVSYFISDDFEQASKLVQRALQLDPTYDRALFLFGTARFAQGKLAEAESLLAKVVRHDPQNPYYRCFYGMLLISENRLSEALPALQRALAVDPSYALAHFQLGRLLARRGDYAGARRELERAVALQPDLAEAYYQLGHTYIRLGEKEKAEQAMALFKKYQSVEYSERQEMLKEMRHAVRGGP